MKKNSKFNLLIFIFSISILSLLFLNLNTKSDAISFALEEKSYQYVISNSDSNKLSLFGKYTDGDEYLINDYEYIDEIFNAINTDLAESSLSLENTPISISFNNLNLINSQPILLTNGNITFSGTITNPSNLPTFIINSNQDNKFIFSDFIISTSSEKVIEIHESIIKTNIELKNSSFESTAQNSYALHFENTSCDLTISNFNNHTTSYFFNYQTKLNILFDNFQDCNLKITLPSNLNTQLVLNNANQTVRNSFSFYAKNSAYTIEASTYFSTQQMFFSSMINLNYNLGGGVSSKNLKSSFKYGDIYQLSTNIINQNYYFGGWFGSLILNNETYYFDNQMLEILANSDFNIQTITTTFAKSLQDVKNSYSISKFYDENDTQNLVDTQNFVALYENLNQIPTIIAKWEYEITFDTMGGDEMSPQKISTDSAINIKNPTREGHSFIGWYENSDYTSPCNFNEISSHTTIYAKWQINEYTLTFFENESLENGQPFTSTYNDVITFPSFTKKGHYLAGWKTADNIKFSSTNLPAENLSLIAIWEKEIFLTYFEVDGELYINPVHSKYLDSIVCPTDPTKEGYTFDNWIDKETNELFDFSTTPDKSRTAVASWTANSYMATFNFTDFETQSIKFGENISLIPTKAGYKFMGWFTSTDKKIETMPAQNISLYPKWQQKNIIDLTLESQTQSINNSELGYKINSSLGSFIIEYYVDNNWTTNVPTSTGKYDVKITRLEDDNYAEYSQILSNGFQIQPRQINLNIAYLVMFALFFIEIVFIIVIKWLQNQKRNAPVYFSIILPFAMFKLNEFIISIIAFVLVIIGFIWMVIELVKLHKIVPTPDINTDYDNRATIAKIEDASNDIDIEHKVEDILIKNNLIKPTRTQNNIDKTQEKDYLKVYDDKT